MNLQEKLYKTIPAYPLEITMNLQEKLYKTIANSGMDVALYRFEKRPSGNAVIGYRESKKKESLCQIKWEDGVTTPESIVRLDDHLALASKLVKLYCQIFGRENVPVSVIVGIAEYQRCDFITVDIDDNLVYHTNFSTGYRSLSVLQYSILDDYLSDPDVLDKVANNLKIHYKTKLKDIDSKMANLQKKANSYKDILKRL